jgi:hypothetical protein
MLIGVVCSSLVSCSRNHTVVKKSGSRGLYDVAKRAEIHFVVEHGNLHILPDRGEPHDDIHNAAWVGDAERVKALLKNRPDLVFSKDSDGATPCTWRRLRDTRTW